MSLQAYEQYDAIGRAELVRRGDAKPEELLESAIERLEAVNPKLNAVVIPMFDSARDAITAGLPEGPLRGVPYLLKDLHLLFAGARTTNGCAMFADHVPDHDSEFVRRCKQAGLVVFGKTATPEFGLSTTTESALFGVTRNPWADGITAGGSSGGAAAAVAAGVVPAANASDGGGSIRIPASCCGLFGLKPTRGRIPFAPAAGEGWNGMSSIHAVTRPVRDSAALLDAVSPPARGPPLAPPPAERAGGTGPRTPAAQTPVRPGHVSGRIVDLAVRDRRRFSPPAISPVAVGDRLGRHLDRGQHHRHGCL